MMMFGLPGNVLWHELGKHARIKVVGVARFGANNDRDGLALVERRLRLRRSCGQQKNKEKKPAICHYYKNLLKLIIRPDESATTKVLVN
jgi:hypothetical protein